MEIDGAQSLIQQLNQLNASGRQVVEDVITNLTLETHQFAVTGIQSGPASGKVYQKYKPNRTHQASAPGQYPMTDTGRLASSVKFELPQTDLVARVGTNLKYGAFLEFGTSKMEARPWLLRSFLRAQVGLEAELRNRLMALL